MKLATILLLWIGIGYAQEPTQKFEKRISSQKFETRISSRFDTLDSIATHIDSFMVEVTDTPKADIIALFLVDHAREDTIKISVYMTQDSTIVDTITITAPTEMDSLFSDSEILLDSTIVIDSTKDIPEVCDSWLEIQFTNFLELQEHTNTTLFFRTQKMNECQKSLAEHKDLTDMYQNVIQMQDAQIDQYGVMEKEFFDLTAKHDSLITAYEQLQSNSGGNTAVVDSLKKINKQLVNANKRIMGENKRIKKQMQGIKTFWRRLNKLFGGREDGRNQ
jgi:hypothetical protein